MRPLRGPGMLSASLRGVLVIVVSLMFVASGAAQPAMASGGFTKPYKQSWTFKSKPLGVCAVYHVKGSITFKAHALRGGGAEWYDQKLHDPTLSINVWALRKGACTKRHKKLSAVDWFNQYWTGYSCSFNPSLSVSLPFAISISGWPSCGNRTTANYPDFNPSSQFFYQQNNTGGVKVTFGDYIVNSPQYPPCYGLYVDSRIRIGGKDDSFSATKQLCLKT
jgi:hypothetical protein